MVLAAPVMRQLRPRLFRPDGAIKHPRGAELAAPFHYDRLMKAVVFDRYGPANVLQLAEVRTPVPRAREVRIRIHAASVSAEDPKLRAFEHPPLLRVPVGLLFGFRRPRIPILGMELAGVVDAVGSGVTRFQVGEPVFGYTGIWQGAHAEYRCLPESALLVRKPSRASFTQAAALANGGLTALIYLRRMGRVRPGERVLIHGASGSVGTAAVQLARHLGAQVTAVCSTRNVELVRSLGADQVIDYLREDCTRTSAQYDVVFDTVNKLSWAAVRRMLAPRGRYLVTHFSMVDLLRMAWTSFHDGPRIIGGASNFYWTAPLLEELAELVQSGEFRPVIDRTYALADAAEAHRYVESGHKRGNVVLLTSEEEQHGS